jgi:hypothetical protein
LDVQGPPATKGKWAIVMGFAHNYENMKTAPDETAYIEVMSQYGRGGNAAKHLANWIQERGHVAEAKTGPNTEDVLMIPAAIEAGLGELGKHGSLIRAQAFGEALDIHKLERLGRYEVHLDRKLERMLSMLLRLKDLRRETIEG